MKTLKTLKTIGRYSIGILSLALCLAAALNLSVACVPLGLAALGALVCRD